MLTTLDFARDSATWPHRASSRFLVAGGLRWHVQRLGHGPAVLLLHGTGTAGHSFAALASLLSPHCTVLIPDLPGHGFTSTPTSPGGHSLPAMATAVRSLLDCLGDRPALIAGHSAGAAVMCRLALDSPLPGVRLVGLAPALWLPSAPRTSPLWPLVARLARSAWLAKFLSRRLASPAAVARLARRSGSDLPPEQLERYALLARSPAHIYGALAMMASWDVVPLQRDLGRLDAPTRFLAGERDPWFPPANVAFAASHLPRATSAVIAGTGHFLHEERPEAVAEEILAQL